jgi:hypothetical protein
VPKKIILVTLVITVMLPPKKNQKAMEDIAGNLDFLTEEIDVELLDGKYPFFPHFDHFQISFKNSLRNLF